METNENAGPLLTGSAATLGAVIVTGSLTVDPGARESYLAGCVDVVRRARETAGCIDFAISADLVDPGRINIVERWESQAAVGAFRGEGVPEEQSTQILGADVRELDVTAERRLT